jgi:hypothetical protein
MGMTLFHLFPVCVGDSKSDDVTSLGIDNELGIENVTKNP